MKNDQYNISIKNKSDNQDSLSKVGANLLGKQILSVNIQAPSFSDVEEIFQYCILTRLIRGSVVTFQFGLVEDIRFNFTFAEQKNV